MVNKLKTSIKSSNSSVKQELNEVLQLWFSINRNMSRGPRIPRAGISLGSLLGFNTPSVPQTPETSTNTPQTEKLPTTSQILNTQIRSNESVPKVTNEMISEKWENSHYQHGFGNTGPRNFLQPVRTVPFKQPFKPGSATEPNKPFKEIRFKVQLDDC